MISKFDRLSEEIFFGIFDYLSVGDILRAFLHLNGDIDGIVRGYKNYHVNFRLICKENFDAICRYIQPSQIKSLVLSDSKETPGLSRIYFSRFSIEQFHHLQAICLSEIEDNTRPLLANLKQLNSLIAFKTDRFSHLDLIAETSGLKQLVLTQFSDVDYDHVHLLDRISFSHLHTLALPYCSYPQLRRILSEASKLKSLTISLFISDCTGVDYFAEEYHHSTLPIKSLTLSISTFTRAISRLIFERFLTRMKSLHYLELIVPSGGSVNLLEGNHWEDFLRHHFPFLSQFHFQFHLIPIDRQHYNENLVLNSFRSTFWIDRSWYVGYNLEDLILYTIPRFVPQRLKHAADSTTLPIERYAIYNDRIREIEFDSNYKSLVRYGNVQRVILSSNVFDGNLLDLAKVEYLCVKSSTFPLKKIFEIIRKSMMRLNHLEIQFNLTEISLHGLVPLEQIRTLTLSCVPESISMDLSTLFPSVEHLIIGITRIHQMATMIDQFTHLSSASFHLTDPADLDQWLSKDHNFTYRLEKNPDLHIHLWMSKAAHKSTKAPRKINSHCGCSLQ